MTTATATASVGLELAAHDPAGSFRLVTAQWKRSLVRLESLRAGPDPQGQMLSSDLSLVTWLCPLPWGGKMGDMRTTPTFSQVHEQREGGKGEAARRGEGREGSLLCQTLGSPWRVPSQSCCAHGLGTGRRWSQRADERPGEPRGHSACGELPPSCCSVLPCAVSPPALAT